MLGKRKIRIGIANLMMLGVFEQDAEKTGVQHFQDVKDFLSGQLNLEVVSNLKAVTNLDEARRTWEEFLEKRVDAVILFFGTFSLSNLMIEIVRNSNVPFLVWGLDEYLSDKGVLSGSMIGLMPAGAVFKNLDKKFSFLFGSVRKQEVQEKLDSFIRVVKAIAHLRDSRIGLIGSRPDGFEISNYDELVIKKIFGTTLTKFSMSYYLDLIDNIAEEDVDRDMKTQEKIFDLSKITESEARALSKVYLATKKIVVDNALAAYAPQCWPELRMERKTPLCPANGRLTAEGFMASCEVDVDCALTMLLLQALADGGIPWTADFVNYFEEKKSLLFWHCGNAPFSLSDEKPLLEVVYEGPAQTAAMKEGTATVCRLNHFRGGFGLYSGIGEVIKSKPVLRGSNMFINMNGGNMEFVKFLLDNGVPHHNVIIYGDLEKELIEFGNLIGIPVHIHK